MSHHNIGYINQHNIKQFFLNSIKKNYFNNIDIWHQQSCQNIIFNQKYYNISLFLANLNKTEIIRDISKKQSITINDSNIDENILLYKLITKNNVIDNQWNQCFETIICSNFLRYKNDNWQFIMIKNKNLNFAEDKKIDDNRIFSALNFISLISNLASGTIKSNLSIDDKNQLCRIFIKNADKILFKNYLAKTTISENNIIRSSCIGEYSPISWENLNHYGDNEYFSRNINIFEFIDSIYQIDLTEKCHNPTISITMPRINNKIHNQKTEGSVNNGAVESLKSRI